MSKINTLFLSYDGMTDALGQSQVLPYLVGLSKQYNITLISFEKKENFEKNKNTIQKIVDDNNITWLPLNYTKKPPVLSTLYDVYRLKKIVYKLIEGKNIKIIHCRSYITALIGLSAKQKFGTKFIFDMRGFWADERVDGKLWNIENPIFKRIYQYFKKKEIQFLQNADYTISLTQNAKDEILSWKEFKNNTIPIQVIPCCVDTNLFDINKISKENIHNWKNKLGIQENDFVLSYLGSVGTWYMLDEMMQFFVQLKNILPQAKFLFINKDEQQRITEAATKLNIQDSIIIQAGNRNEVPELLSLSKLSIFFILPSYSKKASSPTKQGELMAMQIPIVCNAGVGDTDFIVKKYHSGFVIENFMFDDTIQKITNNNLENIFNLSEIRQGSIAYFSLKKGIDKYLEAYKYVL
ncbi:MAG: glycosyltransferase [Sphingobacteriales bacterium]|nr:MAG: glycosyltransferase [Sphingobacteriales bacterium]